MMNILREPKTINVNGKDFLIHKFTALAGREILLGYGDALKAAVSGSIPFDKLYASNEVYLKKLMSFVSVIMPSGNPIALSTNALIDNHISSWEDLVKIEMEVLNYNCSFFPIGEIFQNLKDLAANLNAQSKKTLSSQV